MNETNDSKNRPRYAPWVLRIRAAWCVLGFLIGFAVAMNLSSADQRRSENYWNNLFSQEANRAVSAQMERNSCQVQLAALEQQAQAKAQAGQISSGDAATFVSILKLLLH